MSYIPTLPIDVPIETEDPRFRDVEFVWSAPLWNFLQTLLQSLQQAISNEGFAVPPQPQTKIAQLQASDTVLPGTLIFDSTTVNGGSTANPNGQLFIKLQDGVFHAIPNL